MRRLVLRESWERRASRGGLRGRPGVAGIEHGDGYGGGGARAEVDQQQQHASGQTKGPEAHYARVRAR